MSPKTTFTPHTLSAYTRAISLRVKVAQLPIHTTGLHFHAVA